MAIFINPHFLRTGPGPGAGAVDRRSPGAGVPPPCSQVLPILPWDQMSNKNSLPQAAKPPHGPLVKSGACTNGHVHQPAFSVHKAGARPWTRPAVCREAPLRSRTFRPMSGARPVGDVPHPGEWVCFAANCGTSARSTNCAAKVRRPGRTIPGARGYAGGGLRGTSTGNGSIAP